MTEITMRIGHGYDVHAYSQERKPGSTIVLGGVSIPHDRVVLAHSDGDVIIHAVCDALLGAAGLGDIGRHFPDTDDRYKNIDSRQLLQEVMRQLQMKKYKVVNIDVTAIAEAPKLRLFINEMITNLSADLKIDRYSVNIKATTTEKLGYIGREEGIACHAVVMLQSV